MSLTKNELFKQIEAESPAKCADCKFNWDDKFYVYCPKHEEQQRQIEAEQYEMMSAMICGESR